MFSRSGQQEFVMTHLPVGHCLLMEVFLTLVLYGEDIQSFWSPLSSFVSASVSAADEEKLDERAKLSVAAKRSLFRVSSNYRLFAPHISTHYTLRFDTEAWRNVLPIKDANTDTACCFLFFFFVLSFLRGCRDENLEILVIWFQHSTGTSVLMEHISLHICETDLKHVLLSQLLKLSSVDTFISKQLW